MANAKNELLLEEKNKKRKKYIKSETLMIVLAIILIGTGTGLGIYYGKTNHSTTHQISNQNIIDEINKISYEKEIEIKSKAREITITGYDIQNKLPNEIKNVFDIEQFNFNKITINNNDLQDNDLITEHTINSKINYTYNSNKIQTTNLIIKVINHNKSGEEINNLTYATDIESGSNYQELQARIKTIDYKIQLPNETENEFNSQFLKIGDIKKENDTKITDEDLKTVTGSTPKLFTVNFIYHTYQGTFNLELTILKVTTPEERAEIHNAIKTTLYQGIALLNSPVSELMTLISSNDFIFIKKALPTTLQDKFRAQYFEYGKPYFGTKELQDHDLTTVHDQNKPLNVQVEFKYPKSDSYYDRFNAKLIVIDEPQAIEKYRIVQKELPFIDTRDIPNTTESIANWIKRTYEEIKIILENHNLAFNQEQWIVSFYEYPRNYPYGRTDMLITYLSLPTFNREITYKLGEYDLEKNFNNQVKEELKDYHFQNLINYEQEIRNLIETIYKHNRSDKSINPADWKITKKDDYIEVHYQPRGYWWAYEPINVTYN